MCSCWKMCKNNRGLKIHQEKTRCQTPENKLVAPLKNVLCPCKMLFCHHTSLLMIVSITEHLTTPLFLSQIVRNQLLVTSAMYRQKTSLSIPQVHPVTEYLSNDINQSGTTSCHTCIIFINDQYFKINLTGKQCKTISYDRLSCGSTNVSYGIHCVHCGLVYVSEGH